MNTTTKIPTPDHWACLAGMRFILASIVLFGHLSGSGVGGIITKGVFDYGELAAVVGFFIISGYSIANSITQRPRRYILRRVWRIWPTYLFSFFCCTLPAMWILGRHHFQYAATEPVTRALIIGNLFMLQGILVPVLETNAATWTLAIEECYYLFAPVFRRCASWLLAALILVSAYFYANAFDFGWNRFAGKTHGISHLCFLWAWLAGFLFYQHRNSAWAHAVLFLLPVWLFCKWNQLGGERAIFTLLATTVVIAYGGKLLSFAETLPEVLVELEYGAGKAIAIKWEHVREFLVFMGNVSFPLYIIHTPIQMLLQLAGCRSLLVYLAVIFTASGLVYYFIDKPNRGRWRTKHEREDAQHGIVQAGLEPAPPEERANAV
jgi:peptidoglycan/LPS O-acetylase OafA/YrhL